MHLTPSETRAIEEGQIVSVAVNETECVVLRKDVFNRVQHLIYDDSDLTPDEMRSLLSTVGQDAGWGDPEMNAYDNYDEERAKRCP